MFSDVLFTHNDLDGVGCAVIYNIAMRWWALEGEEYKIYYCSNSNVDEVVRNAMASDAIGYNTKITFSDIVCSKDLLAAIAQTNEVRVFDHHPTNAYATEVLPDGYAVVMPMDESGRMKSGTSLLYDYYISLIYAEPHNPRAARFNDSECFDIIKEFVIDVEEYDTFQFKTTGNMNAKYLQVLYGLLGIDKFVSKFSARLQTCNTSTLIDENDMVFVSAKIDSESYIISNLTDDDFYFFIWNGKSCALIINPMANISELSYQWLSSHPDVDMVVGVSLSVKDATIQLRTVKDDIILGRDFAAPLGGGGHPKAAGAQCDEYTKLSVIIDVLTFLAMKSRMPITTTVLK